MSFVLICEKINEIFLQLLRKNRRISYKSPNFKKNSRIQATVAMTFTIFYNFMAANVGPLSSAWDWKLINNFGHKVGAEAKKASEKLKMKLRRAKIGK